MKKYYLLIIMITACTNVMAQYQATIKVDAAKKEAVISPALHGVFFEEISHGGEGGLYAELIQNRGFEESTIPANTTLVDSFIVPARTPHFSLPDNKPSDWKMDWPVKGKWPAWWLQTSGSADVTLKLTTEHALNKATPHSLQVKIQAIDKAGKANLVNDGFWGINVMKGAQYKLNFFARTDEQFRGPVTASLQSKDGTVLASFSSTGVNGKEWKKYSCTLDAKQSDTAARFVLTFGSTGIVWLDVVSLFPAQTFHNRPNGLRNDLAQYIADLKPAFIRWPGGCFVEGLNVENTPNWKKSIGPVEKRPGTYSVWGYWSSDGFGYDEYLRFCEDIHAAALYVFNIGVSCDFRSGTFLPDEKVDSVIADILDGIEYAVGPVSSKWGRVRAANGHPKPYPLQYIEVGNEQYGARYAKRYNRFYKAIKAKYPQLKIVAAMGVGDVNETTLHEMQKVDIADEHAYKSAGWSMRNFNHFDNYKRGSYDLYVGEYATNNGVGAGNMEAALSDAVYIMAMERNSDLVKMSSYAPLLVNVHDIDWPVNLVNFNAAESFARISYYAIQMFNQYKPSQNMAVSMGIVPAVAKKPLFSGGIGLSTWDTESEYKDIKVIQNGKTVYESDFINKAAEWNLTRGTWQTEDSALSQKAAGEQQLAWLKDKTFDTYTLQLKARKKAGYNAFIIPFAIKDDNTQLRAHIGSWLNHNCVFESVTNGFDVADINNTQRLAEPIDTGRWYDIRLEVGYDKVDCFLDGKLLMSYTDYPKFFSIAGRDNTTGDIIIKVVNAYSDAYKTNISVNGIQHILPAVDWISLSAADLHAENSFEHPTAYIPQRQVVNIVNAASFDITFKPYSINVIRIKAK